MVQKAEEDLASLSNPNESDRARDILFVSIVRFCDALSRHVCLINKSGVKSFMDFYQRDLIK